MLIVYFQVAITTNKSYPTKRGRLHGSTFKQIRKLNNTSLQLAQNTDYNYCDQNFNCEVIFPSYSETKEKIVFHLEWIQQVCHNVFSSPIQQSKRRYQDEHKEEIGSY